MNAKITNFKKRLKHDSLLFDLLCLGVGTIAVSAFFIAPVAIFIAAMQRRHPHYSHAQLKNSFYRLRRKGFIEIKSGEMGTELFISDEARKQMEWQQLLGRVESKRKIKWNGRWFIVIFDIENSKTPARHALRTFIRRFGFLKLQQSV